MATEKSVAPAYASYKSFMTFCNLRRDDEHVTAVVDRTLMGNFSGSTAAELLSALKFLGLITEKGVPTSLYEQYIHADDEPKRKEVLAGALKAAYGFLWNTDGFDLERGTTGQMQEVFRSQGINGSTLARAIGFFLAAAKDAGIKVSGNIKVPALAKGAGRAKPPTPAPLPTDQKREMDLDASAVRTFEIPVPGKSSVKIIVPADFDADDFDMLNTVMNAYIKRWKGYVPKPEAPSASGDEHDLA